MDFHRLGCAVAFVVLGSLPAVAADENATLAEALRAGKTSVHLRARYERVDQDPIASDADALTARLRLNFRTGSWRGLTGFAEYDYVFHLLNDFNSGGGTSPGKTSFPVVADPKGADLNQLYLDFSVTDSAKVRFGRQRILLDNQRFVGGVGWRQNEQTYDGVTFSTTALSSAAIHYSYVTNVRRIFGERVAAGRNNVDAHLLNAKIKINDDWSVTPYYYRIDNDDVAAFSTATAGARVSGSLKLGDASLAMIAELATQSDIANGPQSYDAEYGHASALWTSPGGLSLGLAYESLGGDALPGRSFRTPLATLHAFQGWADKFLSTPDAGIEDLYATVKVKVGEWALAGIYHDFSAETGSADYGSEWDLSASTDINEHYKVHFKGAFFSGDSLLFPDTNKFWIVFSARY